MAKRLVLVLNCGSSSIKFALIEPQSGENAMKGLVQRIGTPETDIQWQYAGKKEQQQLGDVNYDAALKFIVEKIKSTNDLFADIFAVGHRVVHGGEDFTRSVIINDKVLATIKKCVPLAPLHNPANISGIEAAQQALTKLPQIAVFDTAFHQTMPEHAYIYPIPYEYYTKNKVRRYGFHGTSHKYVSQEAARMLGKPHESSCFVTAHLGNGCSASAILNGKSIDTTMGFTPLEGLVMGTRSGDVDPSILEYLKNHLGYNLSEVTNVLNKKSGLYGISGGFSDMRTVEEKMQEGDARAKLAFDIFCYRLAKHIASLSMSLGKLDALVFTGGIGENSSAVRAGTLNLLKMFDFKVDAENNLNHGKNNNGIITNSQSKYLAMVVPTNEELMIAMDAAQLCV